MASLFQSDIVRHLCSCGSLRRINDIYFCRHCLSLRCTFCVSHEVDSHYCGSCSENMPSAEAKQKRNRCSTCWNCPSCKQSLTVRATSVAVDEDDKSSTKKIHFLSCNNCRWTSREVGLDCTPSSSGPWPEPETEHVAEISEITDYFRTIALREKSFKERKFVHKSKYLAAGRHGLAHLLPKRFPVSSLDDSKAIQLPSHSAQTLYRVESEGPDIAGLLSGEKQYTSLGQKFSASEAQVAEIAKLRPIHKQLLVKRSLRCRVCERNIHKPEYSPVSIKFKIQSNAYYHVPQVRLMAVLPVKLVPGSCVNVLLRLSNPIQFPIRVKLVPLDPSKQVFSTRETMLSSSDQSEDHGKELSVQNMRSPLQFKDQILPKQNNELDTNCRLLHESEAILLPPKDETSDFDDFAETPRYEDNKEFVVWRKANKAAVLCKVLMDTTPTENNASTLGFVLEYDYVNTIHSLDSKSTGGPQKVRLCSAVIVKLIEKE